RDKVCTTRASGQDWKTPAGRIAPQFPLPLAGDDRLFDLLCDRIRNREGLAETLSIECAASAPVCTSLESGHQQTCNGRKAFWTLTRGSFSDERRSTRQQPRDCRSPGKLP